MQAKESRNRFYTENSIQFDMPSLELITACIHPSSTAQKTLILKVEKMHYPLGSDVVLLHLGGHEESKEAHSGEHVDQCQNLRSYKQSLQASFLSEKAPHPSQTKFEFKSDEPKTNLEVRPLEREEPLSQRPWLSCKEHQSFLQVTLWEIVTDQPNKLLAKQEVCVNSDVSVLGDDLQFNEDGTQIALVIKDRKTSCLTRCIILDANDLSISKEEFSLFNHSITGMLLMIILLDANSLIAFSSLERALQENLADYVVSLSQLVVLDSLTWKITWLQSLDQRTMEVTDIRDLLNLDELLSVIKTHEGRIALVYQTLKGTIKILEVRISDVIIAGATSYFDIKRIAISKKKILFDSHKNFNKEEGGRGSLTRDSFPRVADTDSHKNFTIKGISISGKLILSIQSQSQQINDSTTVAIVPLQEDQPIQFISLDGSILFGKSDSMLYMLDGKHYLIDENFLTIKLDPSLVTKAQIDINEMIDFANNQKILVAISKEKIVQIGDKRTSICSSSIWYSNPYLINVFDNKTITIMSAYSPKIIFKFQNESLEFLSFVSMINESLLLDNKRCLFKHNTLIFLGKSPKIGLYALEMPTVERLSTACPGADQVLLENKDPKFFLHTLSKDALKVSQNFISAYIGQLTRTDSDLYLTVQEPKSIACINLKSKQTIHTVDTGSTIPMVPLRLRSQLSQESFALLYHASEKQGLSLLRVESKRASIQDVMAFEIQGMKMMECFAYSVLVLDHKLRIHILEFDQDQLIKTGEFKILAESIDDKQSLLGQDGLNCKGQYYRYINKNADGKDEELLFEQQRPKITWEALKSESVQGPKMSADSQKLLYVIHESGSCRACILPVMKDKTISLLPNDDYVAQHLKFSTFTPDNHVIMHVNYSFLAMTMSGKIIHIVMSDDLRDQLKDENLSLIRIKVMENEKLYLLMETETSYLTVVIDKKDFDEFFYTMEIANKISKPAKAINCFLDTQGHMLTCCRDENDIVQIYRDGTFNQPLSNELKLLVKDDRHFALEFLHDEYMVVATGLQIYYVNLEKLERGMLKTRKINLSLNPGRIISLLQAQSKHHLQFFYAEEVGSEWIFTWDLKTDNEASALKLGHGTDASSKIYQGVKASANLYIPSDSERFFDLRYNFPCNFLSGSQAHQYWTETEAVHTTVQFRGKNCQELKVASNFTGMLGLNGAQRACLQLGWVPLNSDYLSYLEKSSHGHDSHQEQEQHIILKHLRFSFDGNSILHMYSEDQTFLDSFSHAISRSLMEGGDSCDYGFYPLFENQDAQMPLALALNSNSKPCIDAMLDSLSLSGEGFDLVKHMKHYFMKLVEIKSKAFELLLDQSHTRPFAQGIKCTLEGGVSPIFLESRSSYLSIEFLKQQIESNGHQVSIDDDVNKEEINEGREKLWKDPEELINVKDINEDLKPVNVEAYEYGWLLKGKAGELFIRYLARLSSDSNFLESKIVHTIVDSRWEALWRLYLRYQFFPFIAFYISILTFNTVGDPHSFGLKEWIDYEKNKNHFNFHVVSGFVMMALALYFLGLHLQMFRHSREFTSLRYLLFDSVIIVSYFIDLSSKGSFQTTFDWGLPVFALAMVLANYHLVLQLRFFEPFAVYINLIYYAVKDSFIFVLILFLVMTGFSNAMLVLSSIEEPDTSKDKMSGTNLLTALMATSKNESFSDTLKYPYFWGIFDGLYGFFVVMMLSSILISILEHIQSHVAHTYDNERLKSKCCLMNENALIFSREKLFVNARYIIKIEKIDSKSSSHHASDALGSAVLARASAMLREEFGRVRAAVKKFKARVKLLEDKVSSI